MKKIKLILLAFVTLILFSDFAQAQFSGRSDYTALYRLYNNRTGDHLYTTDCNEKDDVLRSGEYVFEGVTGYIATRQTRRTMPLYRLLLSNGEHFYTTDKYEADNLLRDGGNRSEGVAGYVSDNRARNTIPFYRLVNNDRHLYTTDEREKNNFLRDRGSRLENNQGFLWTSGSNFCDSNSNSNFSNVPVIYSRENFSGASQIVENDWNVDNDWDGSPNTIRSIRVPQGWYITLYARKNFRGKSFLMSNDAVLTEDNEWYNRIGSIKVSRNRQGR